jgi:hypothetical protein
MTGTSDIRSVVREKYGEIAEQSDQGCGCGPGGCCGGSAVDQVAEYVGYTPEQLAALPEGANLGLGCGNPLAHAAPQAGEVVLDLGSGAGMDAFLAGRAVGPTGRVIGVDMTPQMLEKARANAVALRVLRPGGRMVVSDLVLLRTLSEEVRHSVEAYVGCVAGASLKDDYLRAIREAGFRDVAVVEERSYGDADLFGGAEWMREAARSVVSAKVRAIKP